MNFDLKPGKQLLQLSERFITRGIHLQVMQQLAVTSQRNWSRCKSLLGHSCKAFMLVYVSENTQISLTEDSESAHECVRERCLCVLWWTGDLSSMYFCFWGCNGSFSCGLAQELSE